jgi:hypothetical protein
MMIRTVIGPVERMRFLRLRGWLGGLLMLMMVVVMVRALLVNRKRRRTNPMSPLGLSAFIPPRGIRR